MKKTAKQILYDDTVDQCAEIIKANTKHPRIKEIVDKVNFDLQMFVWHLQSTDFRKQEKVTETENTKIKIIEIVKGYFANE